MPPLRITISFTSKKTDNVSKIDTWIVKSEGNKPESLYKIAGYPEIYGDSYKWTLLYQANKELIDQNYQKYANIKKDSTDINPQDIIFPGQILKVPR